MADKSAPPPAASSPGQITIPPFLLSILAWIIQKFFPWAAGFLLAGGTAGYMVSAKIDSTINQVPPEIRRRLLPPPNRAEDAIGMLHMGNSRCTATVVGPVFDDDREIDLLTAAHCIQVGQMAKFTLKDGRTVNVKCVTRDAASDCAWLKASRPDGFIPYLLLADDPPPTSAAVWHQGYGIDKPNNRENGTLVDASAAARQWRYRLSVSSGDSGGGIILAADNRLLSPVCCTTRLSATGDVWGANPLRSAELRPVRSTKPVSGELVNPILYLPQIIDSAGPQS